MDKKLVPSVILLLIMSVKSDYILRVGVDDYSNPTNRCSQCGSKRGCCDNFNITESCSGDLRCDNEFFFCLRPLGAAPLSVALVERSTIEESVTVRARNLSCLVSPPALRSEIDVNAGNISFMFLGLPNPIEFAVVAREWEGIQLYVDVVDRDLTSILRSDDELVNYFQLDVYITAGGGMTEPESFLGELRAINSFITLSFQVECLLGSTGENCLQETVSETTMTSSTEISVQVPPNEASVSTRASETTGIVSAAVTGSIVAVVLTAVFTVVSLSIVVLLKRREKRIAHSSSDIPTVDNVVYGINCERNDSVKYENIVTSDINFAIIQGIVTQPATEDNPDYEN